MKKHIPLFNIIFLLFASQCAAVTLTWKPIANPPKITQISVEKGDSVFGVSKAGKLFKLEAGSWKKQEGPKDQEGSELKLSHVAVGSDGTLWVSAGTKAYRKKNGEWKKVYWSPLSRGCSYGGWPEEGDKTDYYEPLTFRISVGPKGVVWGVEECKQDHYKVNFEHIWKRAFWDEETEPPTSGWVTKDAARVILWKPFGEEGSWEEISGSLKRISVGNDGSVWGVNLKNEFHERVGNKWKKRSGIIKKFDVLDRSTMFGIDRHEVLHRRVKSKWKKVKNVPSGNLIDVSVASQWTGRTKKVGGKMVSVTEVFGYIINKDHKIWEFSFERYSRFGYIISTMVKKVEKVGEAVKEAAVEETARKAEEEKRRVEEAAKAAAQ